MKTFVRLIRRYVLAAVGIVLLLLFSGVAVLGWLGWQESCRLPQREPPEQRIRELPFPPMMQVMQRKSLHLKCVIFSFSLLLNHWCIDCGQYT